MNRNDLVTTLGLVSDALGKDNLVPVFQCFMFDGANVIAFNDVLGIVAAAPTDVAFAANGKTLLGLLKSGSGEEATFSLGEGDVIIKSGRSTFKLPYFEEKDFIFEIEDGNWHVEVPITQDLLNGLTACLQTAAEDNTQQALMGLTLSQQNPNMTLYSCNGDAVSKYVINAKSVNAPNLIIPDQFCTSLLKIWGDTQAMKGTLRINSGWAEAELNTGYMLYGRIIDNENPPDHEQLITRTVTEPPAYVPVPNGFSQALARARVVAHAESAKTRLTVKTGKLSMVTESHVGTVKDLLNIQDHGDVIADVSAELLQKTVMFCDEMAIFDNCCVFRHDESLVQLISNMEAQQ